MLGQFGLEKNELEKLNPLDPVFFSSMLTLKTSLLSTKAATQATEMKKDAQLTSLMR